MSEEWRAISDFPDYAVSNEGRIKRIVPDYRGRVGGIMKPYAGRYMNVTLCKNTVPHVLLVHRLVCAAFNGAMPDDRQNVAHNDGNPHNNNASNLRWATHKENEADKVIHGTNMRGKPSWVPPERRPRGQRHGRHTMPERTARGERGGLAKLTEAKVTSIRLDARPRKEIAADFGISVTMVGFIQRGISWAHVPMPAQKGEQRC